jgi:hypothetical protein
VDPIRPYPSAEEVQCVHPDGDVSASPQTMAGADSSLQGVVVPIGSDEFVQQTVVHLEHQ